MTANVQPSLPPGEAASIRNLTARPVAFEIRFGRDAAPEQRTLAPGALATIPVGGEVIVAYRSRGVRTATSLTPGFAYQLRHDRRGKLGLFVGSHGRADTEDLGPYVPTPQLVVAKMLELAAVGPDDVVYDIGCGDGRIVITAAAERQARGVGIELDGQLVERARRSSEAAGVQGLVELREEDAMKVDLSGATVVTLYLLPEANKLLRPRLEEQLSPGTRVVTHDYRIPGWEDRLVEHVSVRVDAASVHQLFLYRR